MLPNIKQELLEKPASKEDNFRMLLDLNGGVCEVVTGLVVGEFVQSPPFVALMNTYHSIPRSNFAWIYYQVMNHLT
jgi:septum formation protein